MTYLAPIASKPTLPLTGICGTALLRTPAGPRRAENVNPGDLIVTRDHGLQPVRFVGKSTLAERIATDPGAAAIRIAPRALGPMMPSHALAVAPDQQVLVPAYLLSDVTGSGGLLRARALAGHSDDVWVDRTMDDATFYDFGFDRHEIICVSGLPLASFRPAAERIGELAPDLRDRLIRRYPQLRERRDPFPVCPFDEVQPEAYLPRAC